MKIKHSTLIPLTLSEALISTLGFGQEVLRTHDGEGAFDQLRTSAWIQDLDGDGADDYLLGAPIANSTGGIVYVISGSTGTEIRRIIGDWTKQSRLGWSLADAGDFDGDGVHDIVAGAQGDNTYAYSNGRVDVYSGATSELLGSSYGIREADQLGMSVAGLGDVDGDGFDDVIAGGVTNYAHVLGGPDGHLIRTHWGAPYWATVSGLGDVDQDGRPDYLVGWPQDNRNGHWTGAATVYSGIDGAVIHEVFGEESYTGDKNFGGDSLGFSVGGLGDFDGDSIPDFAAGAPGGLGMFWAGGPGWVQIYSGSDAAVLHRFIGPSSQALMGISMATGGDINAGGSPDIVIGMPGVFVKEYVAGAIGVWALSSCGWLFKVDAMEEFQAHAQDVAILGDLDGDGYAEFAGGDRKASHTYQYAGRVTIYRGAPGDAQRFCPAAPNSSGAAARLDLDGPISLSYADLSLQISGAVPGQFGLFFYGGTEADVAFGNGTLCARAPIFRLDPPVGIDATGSASRAIDFEAPPVGSGEGAWSAGSTWILQFWYRDPMGGGAHFNLSDAIRLTPTP